MSKSPSRCESCYFYGMCSVTGNCSDYSPVYEGQEEERMINTVERLKSEYYVAWLDYVDGE